MKTATIRQVCHNFSDVLAWVAKGEEVIILNRTRPVAKLCPTSRVEASSPLKMPDFAGRSKALFGSQVILNPVVQEREESRW